MVPSSLTVDSASSVSKAAFLSEKGEHVSWQPDTKFCIASGTEPSSYHSVSECYRMFPGESCRYSKESPGMPCVTEALVGIVWQVYIRSPENYTHHATQQLD